MLNAGLAGRREACDAKGAEVTAGDVTGDDVAVSDIAVQQTVLSSKLLVSYVKSVSGKGFLMLGYCWWFVFFFVR